MNGFLLHIGGSKDGYKLVRLRVPNYEGADIKRFHVANSLSFTGWGYNSGDIHYSKDCSDSILILNGYISKSVLIPDFRTQQEACDLLRSYLDQDHSIASLSKLAGSLYGSFSIVYVDINLGETYCVIDRISSRPVWIKNSSKGWYVSSHVSAITTSSGSDKYDLGSLGAFLLYGGPIEPTKSLYKDVGALPESSISVLSSVGKIVTSEWFSFVHTPDMSIPFHEWVHLVGNVIKKSAIRVLETFNRPLIFFSGGVDSRLVASALRSVGGEPILVTLADHENLEVRAARSAARALRCEHHVELRDSEWYLRAIPNAVYEAGGSFVWTHAHFSEAYLKYQRKSGVDAALLGDFSEAFSKLLCVANGAKKLWADSEFLTKFDSLPLPSYRPANKEQTLSLIKPEVRSLVQKELEDQILSRYRRVKHVSDDPRFIGDYFFRWQYAPTTPTFFMFLDVRCAGSERNIMFDNDVLDLLQILPSSMRDGADLGVKVIKTLWPEATKAINSNTALPMEWPHHLHTLAKKARPLLGKLRRRFIENSHKTTDSWPKKSLLYSREPGWRTLFDRILCDKSLFDGAIFDHEAIQKCWSRLCEGDLEKAVDLEKLISIGILKQFHI